MPTFTFKKPAKPGAPGESRSFDAIPEDTIVQAEVVEVKLEEKLPQFRNNENDTHRVSFHFKVTDGEYANRHLWGNTSTWFADDFRCKLRLWVTEILNVARIEEGYVLDTDNLAGMRVRILVGNRTKKDGTITDFAKDLLRANTPAASASTYTGPVPNAPANDVFDEEPF
jgi:hypothetical protein